MPGYLLHVGATLQCPHGGTVTAIPSGVRVKAGGQPVVTTSDTFLVVGCPVVPTATTQPCLKVVWMVGASRVRIGGNPALIHGATGIVQTAAGVPAGPPNVVNTQTRAKAT
jgi:hypothetical protein